MRWKCDAVFFVAFEAAEKEAEKTPCLVDL